MFSKTKLSGREIQDSYFDTSGKLKYLGDTSYHQRSLLEEDHFGSFEDANERVNVEQLRCIKGPQKTLKPL